MADNKLIVKSIPSSFVFSSMKLAKDAGAGEAKLFVGPKTNASQYDAFFDFENCSFSFKKDNLLAYLENVKIEYVFQSINQYKDASLDSWCEIYNEVESADDEFFKLKLSKFVDNSRYYVRSEEDCFRKLFRRLCVPKLTNLVFEKNDELKHIDILLKINYEYKTAIDEAHRLALEKDESDYTLEDIAKKLREMYDSAGDGRQVASIIICGIKYGKQIKENNYRPSAIVEAAGLQNSYYTELNKGVKIYECLADNSFGIGFGDTYKDVPLNYCTGIQTGYSANRIIFGAPGTGKSYTLEQDRKALLKDGEVGAYERVTFHPDYTYSQFVGAYKPVTDSENNIRYKFVPGPFMRLYVKALQSGKTDNPEPHILIIEEINRADVAAVFGDVFQLLDRDSNNVSEYPIQTTEDIRGYLAEKLGGSPADYSEILIPDNMLIWATMNSADQGVFPMDTAFKRRWDFTYLGIDTGEEMIRGKTVLLGKEEHEKNVEWNELRKAINNVLLNDCKVNEDKLMGPFFIAMKNIPDGNVIDPERFKKIFKNKVLMYLFDDAAKQKRPTLFDGCYVKNLYSAICDEFEEKGVDIFGDTVRSRFARIRSEEEQE